ncbi:MAG: type II toxin-antitoxin system RelE/ParE family toxin [Bacteroidales bacterium]|jgi:mRNA-degrading endonuclease RelE of RelBE toxin-antitoxin system|nr:type II toxin-antitoxin system RelE/ParE family toxin [Bacteroidales bacterium]
MRLLYLPPARKYLKKIKDKRLRDECGEIINALLDDPTIGERKRGDLNEVWTYNFRYVGTDYRIAYRFMLGELGKLLIIMVGPHENFYNELKRYLK